MGFVGHGYKALIDYRLRLASSRIDGRRRATEGPLCWRWKPLVPAGTESKVCISNGGKETLQRLTGIK
jgi:hypothetical protein